MPLASRPVRRWIHIAVRGGRRRHPVERQRGRSDARPRPWDRGAGNSVQLRQPERRHGHRLPTAERRSLLCRVRQAASKRHRAGNRGLPVARAGANRGCRAEVLLLPARPLDRLHLPGPTAGAMALGRRLLLRQGDRPGRRERPQLADRRDADGPQPLRARPAQAVLLPRRRRWCHGPVQVDPDPTCAAKVDTAKERRRIYQDWYRRLTG